MVDVKKFIFVLSLLLLFPSVTAIAQTTDEDVEESDRRKTIAENKRAEMDALFPKPDRDSLVGGTEVTEGSHFIEPRIMGYCAMKTAASTLAQRIMTAPPEPSELPTPRLPRPYVPQGSTLVVYNEADVKMLARYELILKRFAILEQGYESLGPDKSALRFPVSLIADTALKALTLLKTDVSLTGAEYDITEREFVAEVFARLSSDRYTLYYPKTIPLRTLQCNIDENLKELGKDVNVKNLSAKTCSPLLGKILGVGELRSRVDGLQLTGAKNETRT
ncbi:MAG TPA: hypothetical protein VJV05_09260, partial [Pyrinomonadaceae bacterium]|nr:hypothetical protein [Pyrinomonadaceae bacterium]